jgi:lipoyl(octanoyl) transferase
MLAEPLNSDPVDPSGPDPAGPDLSRLRRSDGKAVEWVVADAPVPYPQAVAEMEARVAAIAAGEAAERVWLLEHPALYTGGVTARADDLLDPRFPVFESGRGGQYTYHGPGQRVAYVMLDLNARGKDVRAFVRGLEQWLIQALATFNVEADVREGRVGVWVVPDSRQAASGMTSSGGQREAKIAAIGVKVRKWVTFHGISLNVEPDLTHFEGIVPCGIREHGVTSLVDLGLPVTMDETDAALKAAFEGVFGVVG